MNTTELCKQLGVLSLQKLAGEIDNDEFNGKAVSMVKQAGAANEALAVIASPAKALLDTLTLKGARDAMNPSWLRRIAHGGKYNYGDLIHSGAKAALIGAPVAYAVSALGDADKDERRNDLRIKYYNETKRRGAEQ